MRDFTPKSVNPKDYPVSTSVRTDGKNLWIDTPALMHLLCIGSRDLRRLRECADGDNRFAVPIKIGGRNYYSLSAVRLFELTEALLWLEQQTNIRLTSYHPLTLKGT